MKVSSLPLTLVPFLLAIFVVATVLLLLINNAYGLEPTAALAVDPSILRMGYLAAASTTAVSSAAAAYAVARVGSAAVGVLAEKPELFGRMVVLVGLAEGIAIYGVIVSILVLNELP